MFEDIGTLGNKSNNSQYQTKEKKNNYLNACILCL